MRKAFWAPIAALALIVSGCGSPGESDDLLYVLGSDGVAVIRTGAEKPRFQQQGAVPSYDWKTVVTATRDSSTTRVQAVNPSSGTQVWEDVVTGRYRVKIVSGNGKLAALTPRSNFSYEYGRKESNLAIAGPRVDGPRYITLKGNYEPEAFSTDGKSLFVIKYIPALKPVKYQVRRLDLVTEKVHEVYTPDAHLQTAMRGTARIQAGSPDGTRLYTLYTLNDGGHLHTFIHVLSLDGLWAHCIDLPHSFSAPQEEEVGLAVSEDGGLLYVTDSDAGIIAEVDTKELTVTRSANVHLDAQYGGESGTTHAAVGPDGTVYVARGPRVLALSPDDLAPSDDWLTVGLIRGLQIAPGGRYLYVALRDEVVTIDLETGRKIEKFDPPWIDRIKKLGPVIRSLRDRDVFKCAC